MIRTHAPCCVSKCKTQTWNSTCFSVSILRRSTNGIGQWVKNRVILPLAKERSLVFPVAHFTNRMRNCCRGNDENDYIQVQHQPNSTRIILYGTYNTEEHIHASTASTNFRPRQKLTLFECATRVKTLQSRLCSEHRTSVQFR